MEKLYAFLLLFSIPHLITLENIMLHIYTSPQQSYCREISKNNKMEKIVDVEKEGEVEF